MFAHLLDAVAISLAPGRLRFAAVRRLRSLDRSHDSPPLTARQALGVLLEDAGEAARLASGLSGSAARLLDGALPRGLRVVAFGEPAYPRLLAEIPDPPPVLWIRGLPDVLALPAVAVVGSRAAGAEGLRAARALGEDLASAGVVVVSGLARGVDAAAHEGALASGRTVAVLGCGVDVVYPAEHDALAARVAETGASVAEFPPGTSPRAHHFPLRNRIISGLSLATVVVEAGEKSGALITAEFAVEQGRDVFAVPGSILTPQSEGTNRLIEQGARPLLKMSEILESLKLEQIPEKQAARKSNPLNPTEKNLLDHLSQEPVHMDELCTLTGLSIQDVSATLTMMELKGLVSQVGGMNYVAMREIRATYKGNN